MYKIIVTSELLVSVVISIFAHLSNLLQLTLSHMKIAFVYIQNVKCPQAPVAVEFWAKVKRICKNWLYQGYC